MTRHELEFQLDYSITLEEMQLTLTGRLDRFCTFVQLVAGCAVVTAITPQLLNGAVIAILSGIQIVYQPGARAMEAKIQRERYLKIKQDLPQLSDADLGYQLNSVRPGDSPILGSLTHPAYLATALSKGWPIPAGTPGMTFFERLLSSVAGNKPRYQPVAQS